jgi:hypothetical protein
LCRQLVSLSARCLQGKVWISAEIYLPVFALQSLQIKLGHFGAWEYVQRKPPAIAHDVSCSPRLQSLDSRIRECHFASSYVSRLNLETYSNLETYQRHIFNRLSISPGGHHRTVKC